ncbi:glycosyltransferase family 2 protein [Gammaproteobacteria bacterium]|nr:glycosyltransferase family 2 protein [Gammaproteobacteria bacterium]
MLLNLSLIIPHQNQSDELNLLFDSIIKLNDFPSEIIIVDSSSKPLSVIQKFEDFCSSHQISLVILRGDNLYPGHARNLGITKASYPILAFLDTQTLPENNWLSSYNDLIQNEDLDGILGSTLYEAQTFQEKVIRGATYGCKPITTLPGSILRKSIFYKTGVFLPNTRAGEDADWMERTRLFGIKFDLSSSYLSYRGLFSVSSSAILKKWHRNYIHTSKLTFFKPHRDFYLYMFFIFLIVIAYNWNSVVASWDPANDLYIPNITKIMFGTLALLYAFVRGMLMPLKKGVQLAFLFPFGFISILLISFLIDLVKFFAFTQTKLTTLR